MPKLSRSEIKALAGHIGRTYIKGKQESSSGKYEDHQKEVDDLNARVDALNIEAEKLSNERDALIRKMGGGKVAEKRWGSGVVCAGIKKAVNFTRYNMSESDQQRIEDMITVANLSGTVDVDSLTQKVLAQIKAEIG